MKLKNPNLIYFIVYVLLVVLAFSTGAPLWAKIVLTAVLTLLLVILGRSQAWFFLAMKNIDKDPEKSLKYMKLALSSHLPQEQALIVGNALIQRSDNQLGIKTMKDIVDHPSQPQNKTRALIALSMAYWRDGNTSLAVKTLEDLRSGGYTDKNLEINLATYYLELFNVKAAEALISEAKDNQTNGMLDNRLMLALYKGELEKASEMAKELTQDRKAAFPEAWVHAAQIKLALSEDAQAAADMIREALNKRLLCTGAFTREYLTALAEGLESKQACAAFTKAMNQSIFAVSQGLCFPIEGSELDPSICRKPAVPTMPIITLNRPAQVQKTEQMEMQVQPVVQEEEDDDDRMPNTDLDDSDEAWAIETGITPDRDDEQEEPFSNDLGDDDDDRMPNTDLED
ncbi:MAG: hypothetical protein PHI83_07350 [Sphaerochaetaceae bacterium]|jgi:hypothetical protein|nr:hypothetical protein [Sphaerochaetaceae bacterium]